MANANPDTALADRHSLAGSVKDAAVAAGLTAVLGFFFLALRTDIATGGLELTTRWPLYFIGQFLICTGTIQQLKREHRA